MVCYFFEPARSGRSNCVKCLSKITNRSLRVVESHTQDTYFYHASCIPLKALKWLSKRWPGEEEILNVHASIVTAVQLDELKLVLESHPINAPAGAKKRKRDCRKKRPPKEQLDKERAELETLYPVGRKGVISVRHRSRKVTNHFVKVTRCTPRFIELREYEHRSEICFRDKRIVVTRVQADWGRPREDSVFGEFHRVERHRLTGVFGDERQCTPFKGKVQTCYLFEGGFMPRDDHGATTTSIESADLEPHDGDAVQVRAISGKILLRMSEVRARVCVVRDLIRQIEDRMGVASQVQVLAASGPLKATDPLSPLLTEGKCLSLTVIFEAKPIMVDEEGREYPHLVDFLYRRCRPTHPAVKNIDEAFDQEPWLH